MKPCPFCGQEFASRAKHAAKAHKGQRIVFALEPLDPTYAIKTLETLERLSAMARARAWDHRLSDNEMYDWQILLAVVELMRRDAKVTETAA